jgi:hypothetical protein
MHIVARVVLALCAAAPPAFASAQDKVTVTWQGKAYTSATLPDKLGESPRKVVAQWEPWAKKAHYRMDFDASGRVLLVTPEKSNRYEAHLKIVARAETWFDGLLPAPDRAPIKGLEKPAAKPAAAPAPAPEVIPEDPESPPAGAPPPTKGGKGKSARPTASSGATWGAGNIEPDKETAVMLVVDNEKEYASVVEHLGTLESYLKEWSADAKKSLGFVLEQPLCGSYVENASGQEEWNPDHELLNRVIQLLCLRRFGQQPNWVVQGLAWEGEIAFDGALYCFPYRKEFVGVGEHTAWPSDVRNMVKARGDKVLAVEEVSQWPRGRWDATAAKLAWGCVHYLVQQPGGKLSATLEELRQFRDVDDRRSKADGTWERVAGYEVPAETQLAVLKKHFGADVMKTASKFLRDLPEPKRDEAKKDEPPKKDVAKAAK